MQNMGIKVALIVLVLGVCALGLFTKELRLGKDLRGGVSLTYSVDIPESSTDPQAVLIQIIEVLKDRVDPTGTLDISMEPQGNSRIDIVMPLPNDEVKQLRADFEESLAELLAGAQIRPVELDRAVQLGSAVERFCGDEQSQRCDNIRAMQEQYNLSQSKRAEYALLVVEPDTEQSEINQLEQEIADAEFEYENLRREVLRQSLSEIRLRQALQMPTVEPTPPADADESFDSRSPREIALEQIKSEFDYLSTGIDEVVAKYDAFQSQRKGFDDPEDLKRLLRGAGVLEYHIAVAPGAVGINADDLREQLQERGPFDVDSTIAAWFPIDDLQQWYDEPEQLASIEADPAGYFSAQGLIADRKDGVYYLLLYTTDNKSITHEGKQWSVTRAFETIDQLGRPAVGFELDARGGGYMNRMTGSHVNQPMAIVLDGEVFTAPNINGAIGSNGIIQGRFSRAELNYLIKVLAAGSLEGSLSEEPIAQNTLGPSLGQDNLERGREAFIIAIIAVAVFMTIYYFFAGLVAVFALAANGLIIFGFMAGIDGTFTLPGLAGIVLTIGMAVDANVLIYERIREEMFDNEGDLRASIREGYAKALSTIIDANVTNLIVCFVLAQTATAEVKGFALTLAIGICATLFTALFVTRQIYYLYTDVFKVKQLPMLPTAFPAIHRALEPNIKWVSLRFGFWMISTVAVIAAILVVSSRGIDMLDTELRGGVSATMRTRVIDDSNPDAVQREMLTLSSVRERIMGLADDDTPWESIAPSVDPTVGNAVRSELANASILTMGETDVAAEGLRASDFQVKVANPRGVEEDQAITDAVIALLTTEFEGQLDVTLPLQFDGQSDTSTAGYVYPIDSENIGSVMQDSSVNLRLAEAVGGAAIVLRDVQPAVTEQEIERRISNLRGSPDFQNYAGRSVSAYGITPVDPSDLSRGYTDFVVTVVDPTLQYGAVDFDVWSARVAVPEWRLIRTALTKESSLEQVSGYSSAVAKTLQANATVAVVLSLLGILVYIWVRFGSLRYSLAAIVALTHDVIISLGVLGLTGLIGGTALAATFGIEEFRIDLGVVAALLTIIGYSLNDTIVILDRIRENRGKLPVPTAAVVNRSINQTVSRTLLTSVTTLVAVAIMYAEGGSGIRPFTFCLLIGLLVGTYSSVAIAAPLVVRSEKAAAAAKNDDDDADLARAAA